MNLFKNEKYYSLIYNEKTICTQAINKVVSFMFIDLAEDPSDPLTSIVKSLNNASPDNTKFFTVQGKISLGLSSPKTQKQGKVVKEDITLADLIGTIAIHIR